MTVFLLLPSALFAAALIRSRTFLSNASAKSPATLYPDATSFIFAFTTIISDIIVHPVYRYFVSLSRLLSGLSQGVSIKSLWFSRPQDAFFEVLRPFKAERL